MKKWLSLLLALCLLISCVPLALAAEEPAPIPVIPESKITPTPKGIHHYMLICMDSWATDPKNLGHSDGLILVSVDEYARRVMLTSFIRDMLIQRPDGKFGRINNVVGYFGANQAGIDALITTINTHFNLKIEDYIVVDFQQVQNIIDAIGGVDITITDREAQYLRNYSISRSSTTPELAGGGTYHFSGHAAVIYMRIRKVVNIEGETQDVGRTRRARIVLTSIAESLKDISYEDATKLLDVVIENTIFTSMSAMDMLSALDLAMDLRGTEIEQIRMPIDGAYESMPVAGMATQQIDWLVNREALHTFLLDSFVVVEDE
ncbi:MAG: LCP family protein [Clostridiales bacterium]|nr:LCP family protein [Clostridiales bacterium]